jgi:Nif-specific regulatory protein
MAVSLQAKLLRVLQNREVRPVGSDRSMAVNVRVITATNKDLAREVEKGTFREDLFYRLQVIPIHLPPLRARRSDIPILVRHFLEKNSQKYGSKLEISDEALVYLWEYDWLGNVREVENLIERMVVLSENGHISRGRTLIFVPSFPRKATYPPLNDGEVNSVRSSTV